MKKYLEADSLNCDFKNAENKSKLFLFLLHWSFHDLYV